MNLAHDLFALEETVQRCRVLVPAVEAAGRALAERVKAGSKVLTCGNGGSSADAMHFAEEMTGRYRENRKALPALCLAADGSALTCIANDWSFAEVFSRQVEAFGQKGDVLIVFSTSGKSPNIIKALEVARSRKILPHSITRSGPIHPPRSRSFRHSLCPRLLLAPPRIGRSPRRRHEPPRPRSPVSPLQRRPFRRALLSLVLPLSHRAGGEGKGKKTD